MMETFISSLIVLLSYYPVVVPTLVIFSLESAASAKYWQALQRIPHSKPNPAGTGVNYADAHQQKKRSVRLQGVIAAANLLLFAAAIMLFTALLMAPTFLKDVTKLKILYLCTFGIPFTVFIVLMMMTLSGRFVRVVARGNDGKPVIKMEEKNSSLYPKIFFTIFGAMFAVDAIWFARPLGVFVVYAALLHGVTRYSINTKKWKFNYLFIVTVVTGLTAMAVAVMVYSIRKQSPDVNISPFGGERTVGLVDWLNVIMSSLCSISHFSILSLCYRFDYTNSLLPNSQPEVSKKTNIGFIIRYPSRLAHLDKFSHPYFTVTLVSLLSSYVVIAMLSASTVIKTTYEEATAVSQYIAPQMMTSSVLMLAVMKGQFSMLWNYEEDWGTAPSVGAEVVADTTSALLEENIEIESEKDIIYFDERSEVQGEHAV